MIANPITLKNYFEKNQGLDDVGGVEYLVRLTRFSSSVKQAIDYAKIIQENYLKRELIHISKNLSEVSIDNSDYYDGYGRYCISNFFGFKRNE